MAHAELDLRRIGRLGAALVAIIVLVVVGTFALLDLWQVPTGGADASGTQRDARSLPSAPQPDLRSHLAAKRRWLDSAGWVDRDRGIAHIPIEDAQKLLVERWKEEGRDDADAAKLPLGTGSAPPSVDFRASPGAPLPLDLALVADDGASTSLRAQFGDARPVVLVLGYYTCPNLCGIAMHGLVEALHDTGLPADAYRVVGVSIDPKDTPAAARARAAIYDGYARFVFGARPPPAVRLFVAERPAIDALASAIGFETLRTPEAGSSARFAHPTGFVVATPAGRVSHAATGVRFDAEALRLALVDASAGRIGGFVDRVRLLCAHFDPAQGRFSVATMNVARATGAVTVLLLGGWIVRRLRRGERRSRST